MIDQDKIEGILRLAKFLQSMDKNGLENERELKATILKDIIKQLDDCVRPKRKKTAQEERDRAIEDYIDQGSGK